MVDTVRGRLRIRKWPRKRGRPKHPFTRLWNDWFKDANWIAKRADGHAQAAAIALTKGTGLYPRDIMLRAMSVGLIDLVDGDGTLIQNRERRLGPMDFQGALLRLTANQFIGSGAEHAPDWPLPVVDTFGFWSVGAPTLLTIPAGVEIVQLFAGGVSTVSTTQRMVGLFRRDGAELLAQINVTAVGTATISWATGPIVVAEGETLEARYFFASGNTLSGAGGTFFGLQVLQTTV